MQANPIFDNGEFVGLVHEHLIVAPAVSQEYAEHFYRFMHQEGLLKGLFPFGSGLCSWLADMKDDGLVSITLIRRGQHKDTPFGIAWTNEIKYEDGVPRTALVGIGSEVNHNDNIIASRMAMRLLFRFCSRLRVATAEIPSKHEASKALAVATGMTLSGKIPDGTIWKGEADDLCIYSITRTKIEELVILGDAIDSGLIVR